MTGQPFSQYRSSGPHDVRSFGPNVSAGRRTTTGQTTGLALLLDVGFGRPLMTGIGKKIREFPAGSVLGNIDAVEAQGQGRRDIDQPARQPAAGEDFFKKIDR